VTEKRVYMVYGPEAADGRTAHARVYARTESLEEAQEAVRTDFSDGVIYSYRQDQQADGRFVHADERKEPSS
jgi:hypothetical protein